MNIKRSSLPTAPVTGPRADRTLRTTALAAAKPEYECGSGQIPAPAQASLSAAWRLETPDLDPGSGPQLSVPCYFGTLPICPWIQISAAARTASTGALRNNPLPLLDFPARQTTSKSHQDIPHTVDVASDSAIHRAKWRQTSARCFSRCGDKVSLAPRDHPLCFCFREDIIRWPDLGTLDSNQGRAYYAALTEFLLV